jgi:23S rRNA pseudouridine1911/1915/1917 synthase
LSRRIVGNSLILQIPIVGDNKYGYPRGSLRKSICLHARKLQFIHPIKKEQVLIIAPLPKDGFWEKFEGMMGE